jgi:hypothetical protein
MNIKEIHKKIWRGTYDGVNFEINCLNNNNSEEFKEWWTFYLYIFLNRIPEEYKPDSYWLDGKKDSFGILYKYYDHSVLSRLNWHAGITWYSKERGFDGDDKVIKVGCDYQHYCDEGYFYNIDSVKIDVKQCIDSFKRYVPTYKYWCCGNGKLYDLKDGCIKNGIFYSKEYYGSRDWYKEELNKDNKNE